MADTTLRSRFIVYDPVVLSERTHVGPKGIKMRLRSRGDQFGHRAVTIGWATAWLRGWLALMAGTHQTIRSCVSLGPRKTRLDFVEHGLGRYSPGSPCRARRVFRLRAALDLDDQAHLRLDVALLLVCLRQFGRDPLLVLQDAHPMLSRCRWTHCCVPMPADEVRPAYAPALLAVRLLLLPPH